MRLVALTLIAFGGVIATANASIVIAMMRRPDGRHVSRIPLVGGLLIADGVALMPNRHPILWCLPLLDAGTLDVPVALAVAASKVVRGRTAGRGE